MVRPIPTQTAVSVQAGRLAELPTWPVRRTASVNLANMLLSHLCLVSEIIPVKGHHGIHTTRAAGTWLELVCSLSRHNTLCDCCSLRSIKSTSQVFRVCFLHSMLSATASIQALHTSLLGNCMYEGPGQCHCLPSLLQSIFQARSGGSVPKYIHLSTHSINVF